VEYRTPPAGARATVSSGHSVAVFICSSDNRLDVLQRVLPSLFKYWPDRPYPIYLGLNSDFNAGPGVTTLVAQPSEWRKECAEQLACVSETHLIVILDDFLFLRSVEQDRLSALVSQAAILRLPYLRLLPLRKSILQRLKGLSQHGTTGDIQRIKEGRPFYSGLQIAIWNREHFLSLLELEGTIWDFEHQRRPGIAHYAIGDSPPIAYSHLVEKGRWQPYAALLLKQAGLPTELGQRPVWPKWMSVRRALDEMRFHIFGYANH
jgi:hypothetical protein